MKLTRLSATLVLMLCISSMSPTAQQQAQSPNPMTTSMAMTPVLDWMEGQFIPLVEAMPVEKFDFAPKGTGFKGVRSFAEQVQHVLEVNDALAAAILAEEIPRELQPEVIDAVKTKQGLIDLARKSSVFVHRAFAATNENNARVVIKHPIFGSDTSRLSLCSVIVGHSMDHYGQMVGYLRMNDIVPPANKP